MSLVKCWYHYFLDRQASNNFAAYLFLSYIGSILATSGFQAGCHPPRPRTRLINDPSLVYTSGSEYGTRHYVFRRTNLPCLVCGSTIRQLRQVTRADEEGEKTRIIYFFCPTCQRTNVELKKSKSKRKAVATGKKIIEVQA